MSIHLRSILRPSFATLRNRKKIYFAVWAALAIAICSSVSAVPLSKTVVKPQTRLEKFDIALIGDIGYNATEEIQLPKLIQDINNRKNIDFVIHDGDIKSSSLPCTNELFQSRYNLFSQSLHPFIYTPGDNDWTDCHRTGEDPLERLAKLRALFFATPFSLGQSVLPLEQQSAAYPENARWTYNRVLFVTLHVVGTNNNRGRTPEMDIEYAARNTANLAWLQSSFDLAKQNNLAGIMFVMQANMFSGLPEQRTGFNDTIAALQQQTALFKKPVVLVHGDTHYFRVDKVLTDAQGRRLLNFTRAETFGSPDVHWVKASINPSSPNVFEFSPVIVRANLTR
ncbi:MAG: metallophosphoesterase family protein [Thermosynechococcaceae cyanobacterium]